MLERGGDDVAKARAALNRFNLGPFEQIVGQVKCGAHKSILLLSCFPINQQFRLFFRFHAAREIIVYAWFNDDIAAVADAPRAMFTR